VFYLVLLIALSLQLSKGTVFSKKLDSDKREFLFLGDSHIEKAINDSILNSSYNVGQSSESIYFSYFKLRKMLQTTHCIKNVYLGFSYHSLSDYYSKFVDGEYSNAISSKYFYLLPFSEKLYLLNANRRDIVSYIKTITEKGVMDFMADQHTYLGGYDNSYVSSKAQKNFMDKRITLQYYTNGQLDSFDAKNLEYLKKIQELCKQSNVNLVLLNTPLHKYYKSKVPDAFIEKYNQTIHDMDIQVLDLSEMPLDDSCFIPDGDHLSQQGAALTTKYIASQLVRDTAAKP